MSKLLQNELYGVTRHNVLLSNFIKSVGVVKTAIVHNNIYSIKTNLKFLISDKCLFHREVYIKIHYCLWYSYIDKKEQYRILIFIFFQNKVFNVIFEKYVNDNITIHLMMHILDSIPSRVQKTVFKVYFKSTLCT